MMFRKTRVTAEPTVFVKRARQSEKEWIGFVLDQARLNKDAEFGRNGSIEGRTKGIRWWRDGTTSTTTR